MNGEYIITPGQIYYTHREGGDRFKIDNQNKIKYKQGNKIEIFEGIKYNTDFPKNISDAFHELGELQNEKGNLVIFKNKNGDHVYLYNSIEKLSVFDNEIIYSHILFEDRQDQIVKKTEDFCNYALSNNIKNISNAAKLATIKNKEEFILSMSNENYIDKALSNIDRRLMEDIFLLGKGCHIGHYGILYLYAFVESAGQLIPIYFNYDNLYDYDVAENKVFDKIDVIMKMEGKEKVSLFLMKLLEDTMIFKSDVILETELQTFYNNLFINNNTYKN